MGEAAATTAAARPCGGVPPAAFLATAGLINDAMKSAYAPTVWTNTPRSPELPPEARQTNSSSSKLARVLDASRCAWTRRRFRRRSVTTASNWLIISALVMTGRRGRSATSNRSMSIPARRRAWKGEFAAA